MAESQDQQNKGRLSRLQVHYVKSPMFRTIHADGIFGGVTSHLNIQMSFWNERTPIPQMIELELDENSIIGQEIPDARIAKQGLVREIDANVVIDLDTAIAFRDWLDTKIANLKHAIEHPPSVNK